MQRAALVAAAPEMMGHHQPVPLLTQLRLAETLMKEDRMSDHNRATEQHPDAETLRSQHLTCSLASDWMATTSVLLQETISVERRRIHH